MATYCLAIMAKETPEKLRRAIDSVKHLVDYCVLMVAPEDPLRYFDLGMPGEVQTFPWRNYGYNRTELFNASRGRADYVVMLDADDYLSEGTLPENPTADGYEIEVEYGNMKYKRLQILSSRCEWESKGEVHEYWEAAHEAVILPWDGIRYIVESASERPDKYKSYIELLKGKGDPRSVFYLAQSYKDDGQTELALDTYLARTKLGGFQEEVFLSFIWAGILSEQLERPFWLSAGHYIRASLVCPERAGEAYFYAAEGYLTRGDVYSARACAKLAKECEYPKGAKLFVDQNVYGEPSRELYFKTELAIAYRKGVFDHVLGS